MEFDMQVTFYGTRGSSAVSGPNHQRYGGNTTCVRVESDCLPPGMWLLIDAGTGIVPASVAFQKGGGSEVLVLQTHWHHDHTQGFPLSLFPYLQKVPVAIYGPVEKGQGPRAVYSDLMRPPVFPMDMRELGHHISFHDLEFPSSVVLVIHPEGGVKKLTVEDFNRLAADGKQVNFPKGKFAIGESLVVRMHRSNHPEQTINYRFEDRRTGKVFVFVTDHENQDGIPGAFRTHLFGADLLVMDCQYTRERYDQVTSGWGHSTHDYVARVARAVGAKRLALTHHDPFSDDDQIDLIRSRAEADLAGTGIETIAAADHLVLSV